MYFSKCLLDIALHLSKFLAAVHVFTWRGLSSQELSITFLPALSEFCKQNLKVRRPYLNCTLMSHFCILLLLTSEQYIYSVSEESLSLTACFTPNANMHLYIWAVFPLWNNSLLSGRSNTGTFLHSAGDESGSFCRRSCVCCSRCTSMGLPLFRSVALMLQMILAILKTQSPATIDNAKTTKFEGVNYAELSPESPLRSSQIFRDWFE